MAEPMFCAICSDRVSPEELGVCDRHATEPMDERWDDLTTWTQFTKRTDDPKLGWLERKLTEAGIPHRRNGHSFHAPILEVDASRLDEAWAILTPVDDIPDDDPRFGGE